MNWWKEAFVSPKIFYFIHEARDDHKVFLYKATVNERGSQVVNARGISVPASPIDCFNRVEDAIDEWDLSLMDSEVGNYATIFLLRTTPSGGW